MTDQPLEGEIARAEPPAEMPAEMPAELSAEMPTEVAAEVPATHSAETSGAATEDVVEAVPPAAAPMTQPAPLSAPLSATSLTPALLPEPMSAVPPVPPPGLPAWPEAQRSHRTAARFAIAFLFGLLTVLTASAGALAAYESSNEGRILPGVHAGTVDLSGLTPAAAAARLRDAYASLGEGQLVLGAADSSRTVSYADLGRRIDVDEIVALAMGIGREGPVIERIASNVRMFVRGSAIVPLVTMERAALRYEIAALSAQAALTPINASVEVGEKGFVLQPGTDGLIADIDTTLRTAAAILEDPAAPSSVRVELPITVVQPDVTTAEAIAAQEAADRIAVDTTLLDGSETWTISATRIRGWVSFGRLADGGYGPIIARDAIEAGLAPVAADVAVAAVDATFLIGDGKQAVGVKSAKDGRALDVPGTVDAIVNVVQQRADGLSVSQLAISVLTIEPDFTTAEATQTAPLMKPISEWTTYFSIGIKNGDGANIWIPARKIDGTVVQPGEWFDFWKAISPVTREAGYRDGGAIINGRTEPQGALAGGICSTSTTMFNAALRAGLEMGARRNHYYYIDRYPLGLDATVFSSSSGSTQTMSFRNDTDSPILIRGSGWSVGSKGYVKFVIWSAPTGRTVTLSTPIVKNILTASDTTVETTTLAPGRKERVEYPTDGKEVWVTRTVTDASGAVIHEETYYSRYARITGILKVGVAPPPNPTLPPPG
ncbi:MAG: VanW family protein [Chloroflexi bacterium]|nr:VanW family protein [Chloroflexota bacterium]